jgi:hypothetical protein
MNSFKAKRVCVTHEERIKATPGECFSLACPVEELKWIDNWRFDMIYSDSGRNEDNCIFREDMSGPSVLNIPGLSAYWYTTLYDSANHRFHALLIYGDKAVSRFEFEASDDGDDYSLASWRLTYTALNEEGNDIADESLEGRMSLMLSFLGNSAKHYLETGEMLRMSHA